MRGALALLAILASFSAAAQLPMPSVGDRWAYRLTQPDRRDQGIYLVTVGAVSRTEILDQVTIDGGRSVPTRHTAGARLFGQAGGVFSPYFQLLERRSLAAALRDLSIADPACTGPVLCEASGRVAGQETIEVPAGRFSATKIVIEQSWRPAFSGSSASAGARVITVWYSPEMQRAIKYSSRLSFGDAPPMEASFDLELVSYRGAPPPVRVFAPAKPPQVGDNWAYRLSERKRPQATRSMFVSVASVTSALIVEHVSLQGGFTAPWRHAKGGYLVAQGVSVFSPYLPVFDKLTLGADVGYIESNEPGCRGAFVCTAKARIAGEESVETAAGRFGAIKVVVEQSWRPAAGTAGDAKDLERMNGGRTLTVWYAPQVKRAVKYESRRTGGDQAPFEADFDLELTAYQVK